MSLVNLIQQHLGVGQPQLPVRSAPMPQRAIASVHPLQNQQFQNPQRLGAQNTVPLQVRPVAPSSMQGGGPQLGLQQKQNYNQQQQHQIGVTQYNLSGLQPGYRGFNYQARNGVDYHMPAYNGKGWPAPQMALPMKPLTKQPMQPIRKI